MDRKDTGEQRWLLLIGVMIGNKTILQDAVKKLDAADVPDALKEVWAALKSQNAEGIRKALEGIGVERSGESAAQSLIHSLQVTALDNYVRSSLTRAQVSGVLGADRAADFFERMSVNIRARQEAMK